MTGFVRLAVLPIVPVWNVAMMAAADPVDFATWGPPVPTKGYARRAVFPTAPANIVVLTAAVELAAPVRKGSNVMSNSDASSPVPQIVPIGSVETMVVRAVVENASRGLNARIRVIAPRFAFQIVLESNVVRIVVVGSAGSVYQAGYAMERGFVSHRRRPRTEAPAM